jgi:hypothetical protein
MVAQRMYTHISNGKNNKIKGEREMFHFWPKKNYQLRFRGVWTLLLYYSCRESELSISSNNNITAKALCCRTSLTYLFLAAILEIDTF